MFPALAVAFDGYWKSVLHMVHGGCAISLTIGPALVLCFRHWSFCGWTKFDFADMGIRQLIVKRLYMIGLPHVAGNQVDEMSSEWG